MTAFARTWRDFWDEAWLVVQANVLWFIFSLPLITLPPATAGLFTLTHQLAKGYKTSWRDFFRGFRDYFLRSWQLILADAVLPIVILANFLFYRRNEGILFTFLFGFWALTFVFWLSMQPYLFPLMIVQMDKRLRITARNAAVMVVSGPISTLGLLIVSAIIVALSVVALFPVLILTASFLALLYNHAVLIRLKPFLGEEEDQDEQA